MANSSKFTDHDFTIEVHNHFRIEYDRMPDQNYLLILWDKTGTFRGNFGGFERADQVFIAADALRRGLVFGTGLRDIAVVETDAYHDVKPDVDHSLYSIPDFSIPAATHS